MPETIGDILIQYHQTLLSYGLFYQIFDNSSSNNKLANTHWTDIQ